MFTLTSTHTAAALLTCSTQLTAPSHQKAVKPVKDHKLYSKKVVVTWKNTIWDILPLPCPHHCLVRGLAFAL